MQLEEKIAEELKQAMKARDEGRLRALRAIKSAILLAKTDGGGGGPLSPETEIKLLQKLAKQRRESMEIYRTNGRNDLLEGERTELEVIDKFLPQGLAPEAIEGEVRAALAEIGASTAADLSKAMPAAIKRIAGRADNKEVAAVVRRVLNIA